MLRYTNHLKQQIENGEEPGTNDFEYSPDDEQTEEWYEYQNLRQDDGIQRDKVTDRRQKIDVY